MKKNRSSLLPTVLAAALIAAPAHRALAEDIDLFVASSTSTAANPNILFIVDNTANWDSNSQHFPGLKMGEAELRSLYNLVNEVSDKVNVGLMMLTAGAPDGAYVRFHVSQMTTANKSALQTLIGDSTCVAGTEPVTGTAKCIFKNFSTPGEKINTSSGNYSAALFEAFKYFGGYSTPAHAAAGDDLGGTPVDTVAGSTATHFGAVRYSNNDPNIDRRAMDAGKTRYNSPGTACSKNYIVFIGNGTPGSDLASSFLSGVGGSTAQLAMPTYTTIKSGSTVTLGTDRTCYAGATQALAATACVAGTSTVFPNYQGFGLSSAGYTCTAQASPNAPAACTTAGGAAGFRNFLAKGTLTQVAEVPTGTSAVGTTYPDEWAQFLYKTDVNAAAGVQNAQVFTIDVFRDQPDPAQSALLASMAKYGGGKYFQATTESAILDAMRRVMIEIQSVNEVFASASLPINATNRSQNENQVFIGLFRPNSEAKPRWYGNLKRYQIGLFGDEAKLADKNGLDAVDATTSGFINLCAASFWTTDSGTYWTTPSTPGNCTTAGFNKFSDIPDGPMVEKGGVSEVLRLGNAPSQDVTNATYAVNRTLYTCPTYGTCTFGTAPHAFNSTNVSVAALGALDSVEQGTIIDYTNGKDVDAENGVSVSGDTTSTADVRVTVHGDVTHSRPLPVNYGGTTGVVMFYGSNDGMFRAVQGNTGKELWAFIAPEHHSKLKRLRDNQPLIAYPSVDPLILPTPIKKDYFFDGSAGLFQNADNSKIWVYPTMRRGGRVVYALDVTSPTAPVLKWRVGCPNLADDTGCTTGFTQMGQTWSFPNVALVKGYSTTTPLVIIGGGYDSCEDTDLAATTCTSLTTKGNRVFVIDGSNGNLVKAFNTDRAVVGDVTLIDRDFDGLADHGYAADTGGNLYRIDFVDPSTLAQRASTAWTITKIAATSGAARKFLFAPAALPSSGKVYLSVASGDRERPLVTNYPYRTPVTNRAYMFIDSFSTSGSAVDLDGSTMNDFTSGSTCSTQLAVDKGDGWFFDLANGRGEQGVNQSTIFGGLVFFSTNRPDTTTSTTSCKTNLGVAYGYAVNLLNASGAVGTGALCGGTSRSGIFTGGGLPPSPVTGTVPVAGKDVTVMIGGIQRTGAASSPIGSQKVKPSIAQKRVRAYWYKRVDQ
ncbi:MAG TPA: PilC/PilY family type IV pilus protein [Burkholderiales bacterium]|nr:PilC/PilY family type IV pilus protein [Burkholderiales bacterium]